MPNMLERAADLHAKGCWSEAESAYRQVLRGDATHAVAHRGLGEVLHRQGQTREALEHLQQAHQLDSADPIAAHMLAVLTGELTGEDVTERCSDENARAIEFYIRALEENPDHPRINFELGSAYLASEQYVAAAAAFQRSIAVMPQVAASHFNLANAYYALGRLDEAVASYQKALGIEPNAATHNNLGNCFASLRRFPEAVAAFESAIQLDPQFNAAYNNLGRAWQRMGDVEAALAVCRRALARNGDAAETHAAVGEILSMNHETMAEAAESFCQALRGAPGAAHLHASLGDALCQLGQLKVAAEHYVQALQAKPDDPAILNRMASLNLRRGQAEEAAFCCLRALDLAPGFHDAHRNFILALQAEPRTDPLLMMDHAKKWGQRFADVPRFTDVPRLGERSSADSMRIGYLAGDLNRPFRRDLLERIVCHHKALGTEVHVYADQVSGGSPSAGRLRDACHRIAHLDDLSLAERIRDDGIHVLIDLCGQGDDHRAGVLARKPAPVQVGWLGHCGSTGLSAVDHVLADAEVLPPTLADGCVETVTFLPVGYAFFPVPDRAIEPGTVPARSNGYPTFGCLGTVSQLNPELVRIWGGLLRGLPGSRLRLCMRGLEDASVRETVAKQFEAAEVSSDRLKLGGWKTSDERLEACREMDLVLDSYPVNGGLHVLESIWMGLPVVGLQGGAFAGRTTRSFLKTLDLEDFVVDSREAFVETATSLASDLPQLEQLRRDLRPRLLESPLCDDRGFVIHLENACQRMCREASEEPGQPT